MEKKCRYCGTPLEGGKRAYCNKKCNNSRHNSMRVILKPAPVMLKCGNPHCANEFVKANDKKYCCSDCRERMRLVPMVCITCGKEFTGRSTQHNCSRSCRGRASAAKLNALRKVVEVVVEPQKTNGRKIMISGQELYNSLDRVIMAAYERGDAYEKLRIQALNPELFKQAQVMA